MTSVPYEQWGLPYNFGGQHFYEEGGASDQLNTPTEHINNLEIVNLATENSNWTHNHNLDIVNSNVLETAYTRYAPSRATAAEHC